MRVALYVRVSTDEQAMSAAEQERGGRAWCQRQGYDVVQVFSDVGVSGAEWVRRPGILDLQRAARSTPRPFDLVVVRDADRLGRDGLRLPMFLAELMEHGVAALSWSTGEKLYADDTMSGMIATVKSYVAQMQRESIAHNTRTALRTRAERGMVTGGRVYGYDNVRGPDGVRYVVNEREAAVVREIYQRRADGDSARTIARDLNVRGEPSPYAATGGQWSAPEISAITRNTRYRGEAHFGRCGAQYRGGSRVTIVRPDHEVVTYAVPRIVDDELWHAAQSNTAPVREAAGLHLHRGPAPKYLLVGHAVCGVCGGRIGSVKSSYSLAAGRAHRTSYVCGTARDKGTCGAKWRHVVNPIDDIVVDWLVGKVLDPGVVSDAIERANDALAAESSGVDAVNEREVAARARVADLEARVKRLVRAVEEDDSPDIRANLRQRRTELDAARRELDAATRRVVAVEPDDARAILRRLADLRPVVEAARRENLPLLRGVLGAVLTGPVTITERERRGPLTIEAAAAPGGILAAMLPGHEGAARGAQRPCGPRRLLPSTAASLAPRTRNHPPGPNGTDPEGCLSYGPVLRLLATA